MRQYPDCLHRRYKALDDLINELGTGSNHSELGEPYSDPGIKLLCKFWNILKEDPDCNLPHEVHQQMQARGSGFRPRSVTCYACGGNQPPHDKKKCSAASSSASANNDECCPKTDDAVPLSKVLCDLNEAASVDKKCNDKITELNKIQKKVEDQIAELENREKEGVKMMKEADCMWACMEETYKEKIADSIEKQKQLMKEQSEVEGHVAKWRRSKKELELQMKSLEKCEKDMKEKLNRKSNDLKSIKAEIADLKKRISANAGDLEAAKNSVGEKKKVSLNRLEKYTEELTRIQERIKNEQKLKQQKEDEGRQYVKDAREDLQTICRVLLQKKLENEDLRVEIEAVIGEIELLKKTTDQCKDKCQNKQDTLSKALKQVNQDIATFQARCTQCHACVDTQDNRRFCSDCTKCQQERECIYKDGVCTEDPENDCICMSVKRKFMDNVFENMYTVLDRQSKTCAGKAVAEQILACLKNSRNGKLNEPTRNALQQFVLATVKKNLNLTIMGGAVKTRCEMDPDTYKQLMNCLKQLKVTAPEKKDASVPARKDPCERWGLGECNCPYGPKDCVCTTKAPANKITDPKPCPQLDEDKEGIGESSTCPHKDNVPCGPDCGNIEPSDTVKQLVKNYNPAPCSGQSCTFTKNMRAAQCMLGHDSLNTLSQTKGYTTAPIVPNLSNIRGRMPHTDKCQGMTTRTPFVPDSNEQVPCFCGCGTEKPCSCYNDVSCNPRGRIIDEVMGRYTDVSPPIEKVSCDYIVLSNPSSIMEYYDVQ